MFLASFITSILLASATAVNASGSVSESIPVVREFPVCFRWDNPHYDPSYLDNAQIEKDLLAFIDSLGTSQIERIDIIAFASPEGSISRNNELCKLRSAELKWLILKNYPETRGRFVLRPSGESWAMLRERVAADKRLSDASRSKILRTLDDKSMSLDARKWRLSKGLGNDPNVGDIWQYLLRAHYRYIRGGAVIIIYKVPGSPAPGSVSTDAVAPGIVALDTTATDAAAVPVIPTEAKESGEAKELADTVATALEPAVAPNPLADSTLTKTPLPDSLQRDGAQLPDSLSVGRHGPADNESRVPLLGMSTNILYDVTYIPGYGITSIPSLSLEYYPRGGRWTIGADVEWPMWKHWDRHDFMQINNITLWVRRYFKPDLHLYKGAYLFGNVNAAQYGIGWDDKGWEGEGLGGSLGIGYKKYFGNSRFYFDTGLAAGVFWSQYDPYFWGNEATGWYYYDYAGKPEDFQERSKHLLWFGPTRLYFSIGYDLLMRKRR